MYRKTIWVVVALLMEFVGSGPSNAQDGANLLANGGFEDGALAPWSTYGGASAEVVRRLEGAAVPEDPIEGDYCLHLVVPAPGVKNWDVGLQHAGHVFKKGKKYTLSVFLKCRTGTLRIRLQPELGQDPWPGYSVKIVTMTNKWAEYSTTTPIFAQDVTPGTITFHIAFATGDFWIDSVRFYEGDYVPPVFRKRVSAAIPSPEDGAVLTDTQVSLSWFSGPGAAQHDVYLGTERNAVENADRFDQTGIYRGPEDVNIYAPPDVLEFAQTYYWRIDEVQADLTTIHRGNIWSFTVPPEPPYLADLAAKHGMWIGAAASDSELKESGYRETFRREFNLLTPVHSQMMWNVIHPERGRYNFIPADETVDFAEANGMRFHGHNLCWYLYNPVWLTDGHFTHTEMIDILRDHIHTVVGRYAGRVAIWDVVNEPIRDDIGELRDPIWKNTIGPEYIDLAFQFAHEADPKAILIINEYSIEPINTKSTTLYNLVRDMLSRQTPIHGVGFQMHLALNSAVDYQSFADNMRRFANLGLQIYVTEMNVWIQEPVTSGNLATQATVYRNVLDKCLGEPACVGFQTWGFTDKYLWIPGYFQGWNDALIFDRFYRPKPAYYALREELLASLPPDPSSAEGFETGDFNRFAWEFSGGADWVVTSGESNSGTYSAMAGSIGDGEQSSLRVEFDCLSGDVSFYCKVSSESGCDYLRFYIDGDEQAAWSGEEDWRQVSFPIGAGRRTFQWEYYKDGSVSSGNDTAWIDDIVLPRQ